MPWANATGVRLHYETYGHGDGILGIHGTPSAAVVWREAAETLGVRGRCIIYDRRGSQRSDFRQPATDLADQVDDAALLLGELVATPAIVIGRSTGGLIALELARRQPAVVRALVLLEPAVFTVDPVTDAWARAVRERTLALTQHRPETASKVVISEALGEEQWEALPRSFRELLDELSPMVLSEMRGHGLDLSADPARFSQDDLARIDQPTLLVSSEDSPEALRIVNDRLAERLPNASSATVTGGHVINPAHPAVLDFVDRVLSVPA